MPDAPGWYPDPDGAGMRRWDGAQWTGERRDMPPWSGPGPGPTRTQEADPQAPTKWRRNRHWLVLGTVAAFLFLVVSYKGLSSGADLPDRTLFDAPFIDSANRLCEATLVPLKAERPRPGSPEGRDPGPKDQIAATVDRVADQLRVLAGDLREIPVQPQFRAVVDGWLADWDTYIDFGHQYADAVREESPRQTRLADQGAAAGRRANLFAEANKLDDCTFT
jgi:hypothetical protein